MKGIKGFRDYENTFLMLSNRAFRKHVRLYKNSYCLHAKPKSLLGSVTPRTSQNIFS